MAMDTWSVRFEVEPSTEGRREALTTLGNGYLATRGAGPEHTADGQHYPGTYLAGCYNRLDDLVDGHTVENESAVNIPNWLPLTFRAHDGAWWGGPGVTILSDRYELDLRRGVLHREVRVRDRAARTTVIRQDRLVHLRRAHVCALRTILTAEDWSGQLSVRAGIDPDVANSGVDRYKGLSERHLVVRNASAVGPGIAACDVVTSQSGVRIAVATRTRADGAGYRSLAGAGHELSLTVHRGQSVTVEKLASIHTSRDPAMSDPLGQALEELDRLPGYEALLAEHEAAWSQLWHRFAVHASGRLDRTLAALRLNLFHVLQTITLHTQDGDAGVPARGMHGEAYRGHVLWDELFVLPLFNLHAPALSRGVLHYRFVRLDAARAAASRVGARGAMFPWQSGSDGREEGQRLHLNPVSGRWVPDDTFRQRHVGLAIAYNVWLYWQATADGQFLERYGAELILEVAKFFASITEFDRHRDRYVIRGVMGPDEFHTGYPGTEPDGIDNNAYTNVMTVWLLHRAADTLAALTPRRRAELRQALGIDEDEERRWEMITRRMYVPFHGDGILSQFEGYADLEELDWDRYRSRYGDIRRLDRILAAEGDDPNRYRVSKQADALMLFYLLSADELGGLLEPLGYTLPADAIPRTIDYYLARTSHGSTLSAVVHSWVLARSRRAMALDFLCETIESDIADIHAGTTAEGIHLGAMAGSLDLLQRCFTGLEVREDTLWLNPFWPDHLGSLAFTVHFRQHEVRLRLHGTSVHVTVAASDAGPMRLRCWRHDMILYPGDAADLSS
jgi:trehalose/maltose hydrolase-like predicted phosphorylase